MSKKFSITIIILTIVLATLYFISSSYLGKKDTISGSMGLEGDKIETIKFEVKDDDSKVTVNYNTNLLEGEVEIKLKDSQEKEIDSNLIDQKGEHKYEENYDLESGKYFIEVIPRDIEGTLNYSIVVK